MENTRQNKIAKLLEHDLANIFQHIAQDEYKGTLISITKINVTSDLGIARIKLWYEYLLFSLLSKNIGSNKISIIFW